MNLSPFSNAITTVTIVLVLLALPYAAIQTFGLKARNIVLPIQIAVAIVSVTLLVVLLIKHRLSKSGTSLKMLRLGSSDPKHQGNKRKVICYGHEKQIIYVLSFVSNLILKNYE